ncbi:trithorax group protein osa isoform X2 [Cimex lectularius]|uniref:CCHC-type domain-containing protein n=1 Tax=Cimex lectularius TaxID=79782 RepID=A0A8I6RQK5_CIMLE|nr:trithorax group protein osa isoform X2 [Cimex lectularius]
MVCKKDVLTWFKGLKSYKRTDLMCSLLNLCLPVELRFLGTCLEHLGKRDFHELRQAESEANSNQELSSPETQCLSNQQLRTKLAVYVSVLYSCNYSCSNNIYKILTKNEDVAALLKASAGDENALDDLLLVYILAINHPAFSFNQKLNLEKIFRQLHEEEAKRLHNRSKSFNPSPQEQEKPQNLTILNDQERERYLRVEAWKKLILKSLKGNTLGYPACISLEDGHIIGVGPQLPNMPPNPHHPGDQGLINVHDGNGGNGTVRLSFPPGAQVPPPGAPAPLILNASSWTVIQPPAPGPGGDSPMASRTSSPSSRAGSPSPPHNQQPHQIRLKFASPRVPPPGDALRDTIGKEMPKFATHLQNFSTEQLSLMSDEELKEIGLTPCAINQLRSILLTKQVILTNGIGPPPTHHMLDVSSKKKMDAVEQDNMVRRYPIEGMAMYPIPSAGLICQPSQCYSCYAFGPRKCLPIQHHYPPHSGIALGPPPPPPTTLPQHLHQPHGPINDAMRNLRLDNEQSSASDTASDNSPPDTPAPQHPDGTVLPSTEDRLSSTNMDERRGGVNSGHGRSRGIGRNRSNPPGIQTLTRGRGPNHTQRRRDVSSNMVNGGVDERKMYQQQGGNGSGSSVVNSSGGNGGSGEPTGAAPGGYFSYMSPYLRPAYPTAYHHPAAYVRHAYPTAYHNGDLVYQYPSGPPPPGANAAGTFLPPPPPPPSFSPVAPPPQQPPPPPSQVLKPPSCYNCGSQSHVAMDCPDPTIEEVTKQGQYRIDFTTNFQKQPGDVPGTADK